MNDAASGSVSLDRRDEGGTGHDDSLIPFLRRAAAEQVNTKTVQHLGVDGTAVRRGPARDLRTVMDGSSLGGFSPRRGERPLPLAATIQSWRWAVERHPV